MSHQCGISDSSSGGCFIIIIFSVIIIIVIVIVSSSSDRISKIIIGSINISVAGMFACFLFGLRDYTYAWGVDGDRRN